MDKSILQAISPIAEPVGFMPEDILLPGQLERGFYHH